MRLFLSANAISRVFYQVFLVFVRPYIDCNFYRVLVAPHISWRQKREKLRFMNFLMTVHNSLLLSIWSLYILSIFAALWVILWHETCLYV